MQFNQDEMLGRGTRRPNQEALLTQLGGPPMSTPDPALGAMMGGRPGRVDQMAPDAATAQRNREAMPDGPLKQMIGAMGPVSSGVERMPRITPNTGITGTGTFVPGSPFAPGEPAPGTGMPAPGAFDRSRARDLLQGNGGSFRSQADIEAFIAQHPELAGVKVLDDDDIELPNGERYDVVGNQGTDGRSGTWTPIPGRPGTEWASMPGQDGGAAAPAGGAPAGGIPVDPLLAGDPLTSIQAALGQYANQRPNLEALLRSLGVER